MDMKGGSVAELFTARHKERKTKDENRHVEVHLFSDHLGLPVNLLPVGYVTQEVVALCSRETDLLSCFFQALLCSAPQDHLMEKKRTRLVIVVFFPHVRN